MLRQLGAGQCLPDAVVTDVGYPGQAIEQTEGLQDPGIDADADAGVSGFDSLQGGARRESALRHDCHGEPPATTGVVNVRPELAERSLYGGGRMVRGGHM